MSENGFATDCELELAECVESALEARDDVGYLKSKVYFVLRTWSGERPGDGDCEEEKTQMLPTPYIVDLSHDVRIQPGGNIKQGDILLRHVSRSAYPLESDVNPIPELRNCECFYEVCDQLYQVISVKQNYATWDIQIRKISDERRAEDAY